MFGSGSAGAAAAAAAAAAGVGGVGGGAGMPPPAPDDADLAERVFARSIPASRLPVGARLGPDGGMLVTAELRAAYAGHENLLAIRALHAPACYAAWDALRLCVLRRPGHTDEAVCGALAEAYRPCDDDLRRRALARKLAREDQRRRLLAADSRAQEAAQAQARARARADAPAGAPPPPPER